MFGNLGSGKRTLAAQVAIRLAKENPNLKIKIVTQRDTITEDLESRHSTILIIHDPLRTWYTDSFMENIISILLRMCMRAKNKGNAFYVIAIFFIVMIGIHFNLAKRNQQWKQYSQRENIFIERNF